MNETRNLALAKSANSGDFPRRRDGRNFGLVFLVWNTMLDPGTSKNIFSDRKQNETRHSTVSLTMLVAIVAILPGGMALVHLQTVGPPRQSYFGYEDRLSF